METPKPPPLFTRREKYALAVLTLSFIALSAVVHFVLGSIGGSLFPHVRHEAAAPPQIVDIYRLETPTPTPVPVPTPRIVSTPQPAAHGSSEPRIHAPSHPRRSLKPGPTAVATAPPPHGTPAPPGPSNTASPAVPAASPAAPATPVVAIPADFVDKVVPDYPDLAQQENVEGQVTVMVTIGPDGRVENAVVFRSSGSRLLDDAALAAARASTFRPPLENGLPVTRDYLIVYTFALDA